MLIFWRFECVSLEAPSIRREVLIPDFGEFGWKVYVSLFSLIYPLILVPSLHCFFPFSVAHLALVPLVIAIKMYALALTLTSLLVLPAATTPPPGAGLGNWAPAYAKARTSLQKLTLTEKVGLVTGIKWSMLFALDTLLQLS